ncbi:MAG: DUF3298 and DUF4163 domain-containing protein [Cyclobacteriaceae bacterium]|nr:DUF3298 and DUF4163 domain-containing protein [Cyclobacteriaceae bacterium]MDX5467325.1 DUF3298 and DUF4163 domain-containing protein [Cyclobacteriaceae bacterium]
MRHLFYPAFILWALACAPKKTELAEDSGPQTLTFSLDSLVLENCVEGDCANLRLVWPMASGPEKSSLINAKIKEAVTGMMMIGESPSVHRDTLIAQYFKSYRDFKNEFPDSYGAWEVIVQGKVTYKSDSTLSISVDWMNYLGGAHPNYGQNFLNFDPVSGKFLSPEQLVRDEAKLLALAEQKFREFHQVEKGKSLEEDGRFFLPETGFFLGNSMGFAEEKFKIIYIPYEIGPYAMGFTELEFTREELGELVRW